MELTVNCFNEKECTIEVGEDDTMETMREKVASAAGLAEDSFRMGFGGKEEGEDITELSAGDTIVLSDSKKYTAIAALRALGKTDLTADMLKVVKDPAMACLLLQAGVATVTPKGFLYLARLTEFDLSVASVLTAIDAGFLPRCTSLTRVDLSGLTNVTRIGACFLQDCSALTELDLSGLVSVKQIGNDFLRKCSALATLDLSALAGVAQIGNCFVSYCTSLESLDLSPLGEVMYIGTGFLQCSIALKIDVSRCSSLVERNVPAVRR